MDETTTPEDDDLRHTIEIHADDVDVDAVMQQMEANVRRRRADAAARGIDADALAAGLYRPAGGRFSAPVYHNLRRARALADQITVAQHVSPRVLPLVGGLVQRLRAALHELVIFYVDMLASKQILFNEATVNMVQALVADLEREGQGRAADMAALQAEVRALRAELAELRSGNS